MKKLPLDIEVCNLLVGEVDFLESDFIVFVRLVEPSLLDNFTEIQAPSRFLFIALGPEASVQRNHQLGRTTATILIDDVIFKSTQISQSDNVILI
jgi:sodium bicarbonate cotransporter 4